MKPTPSISPRLAALAAADDCQPLFAEIRNGADISSVNIFGHDLLCIAVAARRPESVRILLDAGASPEGVVESPLSVACRPPNARMSSETPDEKSLVACARLLLEAGASPSRRFRYGGATLSPLAGACAANSPRLVELLLKFGAEPWSEADEAAGFETGEAYRYACRFGRQRDAKLLLSKLPDKQEWIDKALLDAASSASLTLVSAVCERKPSSEALDKALASASDAKIARRLLELGANPDASDEIGATALLSAAYNHSVSLAETLLEFGADPLLVSGRGDYCPVRAALRAKTGRTGDFFRLLFNTGLSPDAFLSNGASILSCSAFYSNFGAARAILSAGASVSLAGGDGVRPLHRAAQSGDSRIIELFLEAGANPDDRDSLGRSTLHYAARSEGNALFVTKTLIAAGADASALSLEGELPENLARKGSVGRAVFALIRSHRERAEFSSCIAEGRARERKGV